MAQKRARAREAFKARSSTMPRAGCSGNHCVAAEIKPSPSETPGTIGKRLARFGDDRHSPARRRREACNSERVRELGGYDRKYVRNLYELVRKRGTTTSMLDTGVLPWMERLCENRGCVTKADNEATVKAVWGSLTAETLGRVADRVRRNMHNIVKMKGGN